MNPVSCVLRPWHGTAWFLGLLMGVGVPASTVAATPGSAGASSGLVLRPLSPAGEGRPGFVAVDPVLAGMPFTNVLSAADGAANRVLENGSGVALGDADGDGRTDVFLCGLNGNSALYRNLGNWRFRDVTDASGLVLAGEVCRGAVFADLNGDRREDLLVSTLAAGVRCFLNAGGGRFQEATAAAGTGGKPGSTTLALADVDANGTLDLYVTRYRENDIRDNSNVEARVVQGRTEFHPKYGGRLFHGPQGMLEYGEPDVLYLNDGSAHFREVSWTDGAFLDEDGRALRGPPRDWGLSATFRDVNGDGWPDLYVCNDYWTPDRLWMNQGNGTFRAVSRDALRQTCENSMGVDFADLDRDGDYDFLVLDMLSRDPRLRRRQSLAQTAASVSAAQGLVRPQVMRNSLYQNRGDGTFAQIADYAGLAATDWSWQPLFVDVDLDGFEDVLISAGHRRDVQDLDATERVRALQRPLPAGVSPEARQRAFTRDLQEHSGLYPTLAKPVQGYRNLGDLRFQDVTESWGLGAPSVHQGMALGDLDGDGDMDLVVSRLNEAVALYRNTGAAARVVVTLKGGGGNTAGIGAEVRLLGGAVPVQSQQMVAGGRYLSGSQSMLVFAAGKAGSTEGVAGPMECEVRWPRGGVQRMAGMRAGQWYEIEEPATAATGRGEAKAAEAPRVWFEDVSNRLNHVHRESDRDDAARQPLLPRRLSQGGPSVVWFDANGDGFDDLLVGGSAGGSSGVFTNDARGGFQRFLTAGGDTDLEVDQRGIVGFRDLDGRSRWIAAQSQWEGTDGPAVSVVDRIWGNTRLRMALPGWGSSVGPLAMADVDGDGDLDLFAGGEGIPGRYPEPAVSRLFLQEPGGWRSDVVNRAILERVGRVDGAAWGDLDGDGDADLVLAGEWGALRVLRNDSGVLVDATESFGLDGFLGLWRCVALGDFDGDGRLDIVAGNRGLNTPLAASREHPLVLYYGDLLDRGVVDVLETEWDVPRGILAPRHSLETLSAALPLLRQSFSTHRAYSEASADDVLRALPGKKVRRLEATTLSSMVFLNRGTRFAASELPRAAQWSPVQGLAVGDFDGDGVEDLFLAQNSLEPLVGRPPEDAGMGLLLRGLGDGRFDEVPPARSGIQITGEQRGAAVSDFDGDGRLDLVVGQNGGATRLFRNRSAQRGLRVRFEGPAGNREGVGVMVRARSGTGGGWGPVRQVMAGGGGISQGSATLVMGGWGEAGGTLEVRWPGQPRAEVGIKGGRWDVVLGPNGNARDVGVR